MAPAYSTITEPARPESRRQRARALFARLRHKQLISAMAGRVTESAVYAKRALRVSRSVETCTT